MKTKKAKREIKALKREGKRLERLVMRKNALFVEKDEWWKDMTLGIVTIISAHLDGLAPDVTDRGRLIQVMRDLDSHLDLSENWQSENHVLNDRVDDLTGLVHRLVRELSASTDMVAHLRAQMIGKRFQPVVVEERSVEGEVEDSLDLDGARSAREVEQKKFEAQQNAVAEQVDETVVDGLETVEELQADLVPHEKVVEDVEASLDLGLGDEGPTEGPVDFGHLTRGVMAYPISIPPGATVEEVSEAIGVAMNAVDEISRLNAELVEVRAASDAYHDRAREAEAKLEHSVARAERAEAMFRARDEDVDRARTVARVRGANLGQVRTLIHDELLRVAAELTPTTAWLNRRQRHWIRGVNVAREVERGHLQEIIAFIDNAEV